MSDNWQQDAVDAWNTYTPESEAAGEQTPDTMSMDDLHETDYHSVYSDADNNWYAIEDDGDGQHVATPVDREQVELESNLMASYLQVQGQTFDTASHEQIMAAAEHADAWLERAEEIGIQQVARSVDAASRADELALSQTLNKFIDDNNLTEEEASRQIDHVFTAMENGGTDLETGLRQASEFNRSFQAEVNATTREDHFAAKGYHEGVKSALSNFMTEQHGPRRHSVGQAEKPAPVAPERRLGNPDVAKNQIDNAISRFAAQQRAAGEFKQIARDEARRS